MSQPLVAFCIPTYNHGEYLPQCIDSVLAQEWDNIEIWIGDDCSTDETQEIVRNYQSKHSCINYNRNESNLGTNANLQNLLRRPSAPFIARLDADDYVGAQHTHELVSLLLKYSKAGYAHSAVQTVLINKPSPHVRRLFRFQEFHSAKRSLRDLSKGLKMCANMPIYRREALRDIDYIAGAPFSGEDYFTACRFADSGWGNAYSRKVLGYYRVGLSSQWSITRNIKRANGLCVVFDALEDAYRKRHWPCRRIETLRKNSALNLARGIFGRRGVTEAHERQAQEALHRLFPEILDYKTYIEQHPPGLAEWRTVRMTKLKKVIKAALPI